MSQYDKDSEDYAYAKPVRLDESKNPATRIFKATETAWDGVSIEDRLFAALKSGNADHPAAKELIRWFPHAWERAHERFNKEDGVA